jgi:predicted GNAT family acetyltransferase/glutaredoxin
VLTLYQAEWCPFSSAVREILTELGLDFLARQVEPWPEQRDKLRKTTGSDQIPTLQTEDGRFFHGTRAIYAYLEGIEPWEHAGAHRRRFVAHRDARESDAPGQLVAFFPEQKAEEVSAAPEETEVVDVREESRYELRLGERTVGLAAYHRRPGRIAFTHTEIDGSSAGRGFGSRLAAGALDDARRQGLEVVPLCPFIARYIERHPEYEDLVATSYRDRLARR